MLKAVAAIVFGLSVFLAAMFGSGDMPDLPLN